MYRPILLIASALVLAGCSTGGGQAAASSAAPSAATMQVMGKGDFMPVDGTATGLAELVVQPDGGYEVVLEDFSIESTDHTNVVLVSNESVTSTADVDKANLLDLGPLTSTSGMQSYVIPADMAASVMEGYHSVVIWDSEMAHAVAAASLK
jgi:hypothetical protein